MSTRCLIGKIGKDGFIKAIYCHHDGYISYVGKKLYENYKRRDVNKLLKLGDMSSLSESVENCDFYKDNSTFAIYADSVDFAYNGKRECGAEYVYYIDTDDNLRYEIEELAERFKKRIEKKFREYEKATSC